MTADDGAPPLTRRAAREARRAAAAAQGPSEATRRAGWQVPLGGTPAVPARDDPGTDPAADDAPPTGQEPTLRREPTAGREPATRRERAVRDPRAARAGAGDDLVADVAADPPAALTRAPVHAPDAGTTTGDAGGGDGAGQPPRRRRTGGLAQAGADDFSFAQAVGGVRGAAETLVPGLLFVSTYTLTRDLTVALAVSVGAALLAIVLRVVTRSGPTQALSGAVGVGICAVFALLSGEARNFYLPGFLLNVGYGLLCLLSTVPFPRFRLPRTRRHVGPGPYPVIGLLLGPLTGEGLAWRQVPARLRVYQRVTWLWAGFFLLRLAVQVPLYLADLVGPLGAARLAMGVPAFALMVWISWLLLRSVPRAVPEGAEARPTA